MIPTIKQVLDAIRKNGLGKVHGVYFETESGGRINSYIGGTIKGGCAIGQAAINLGVEAGSLHSALSNIGIPQTFIHPETTYPRTTAKTLGYFIQFTNDDTEMSLEQIADRAEEILKEANISLYTKLQPVSEITYKVATDA